MRKETKRKILKGFVIILIIIILLFSVGTYLLIKNKDVITNVVIKQLNEHLITPVHHDEINLSLFKKIPYIAIEFKNVWAENPDFIEGNDTLFSVKSAYVLIDIFEAIRGNYSINKLQLNNGLLNMYIGDDGRTNYNIWKSSGEKSERDYQVNLQDLSLQNIRLTYFNHPNNFRVATTIHSLKLNGEFNKKDALLNLKSNLFIQHIFRGNVKYIRNGNANINVSISKKDKLLSYKEGTVRVNRQRVETQGFFNVESGEIDISIKGENIRFDSDQNIFNLDRSLTGFSRVTGVINTIARIYGNTKKQRQLNITTQFKLSSGQIALKGQGLKYKLHFLTGQFKSFQKTSYDIFQVDSMYLTGNVDTIQGNFRVHNFNNPRFKMKVRASLGTESINAFLKEQQKIGFGQGRVRLDWNVSDVALKNEDLWKYFIKNSHHTNVEVSSVNLMLPEMGKEFKDISAQFYLNENMQIKRVSCHSPDIDVRLEGQVSNLYNLFSKKNTWIDLRAHATRVELLKLVSGSGDEGSQTYWPQHVYVKFESMIDDLVIDENSYLNTQSELYYKPGLVSLKIYNSEVFGGHLKGNCALALPVGEKKKFAVIAEAEGVDINQMFYVYKEFGQDFITSKNLKGKMDVQVNMKCNLDNDYKVETKSLLVKAGLQIKNGELMDHEPMYSLSKYINLEELKHIYFADLSNEVYIRDECVTIPGMHIVSSALDIDISGKHYFDNRFEYNMTLYLSDLLAKKVKRNKQNEDAFTFIKRNNAKHFKIPLIMKGNDVDFSVEINKKQARENFSKSVQREKEEIKSALKQEFKIFSKDTAKVNIDERNNTEFKIEFEEKIDGKKDIHEKKYQHEVKDSKTDLKFEFDE